MLKIQYKDFNKDSGFNTNIKCFLLCIDTDHLEYANEMRVIRSRD